jgi:predicted nucleotidyltransferase
MDRQQVIDEAVRRMVDYFQPEQIWLFGSTARGDARPDSDLDFLVVVPDDQPNERFFYVQRRLCGLGIETDVVPMTRSAFEARRNWLMSLPAICLREGKLLYDSRPKAA